MSAEAVGDWGRRASALVDELARDGALRSPQWRAAFETVPRHVFVPRFYRQDGADPDRWHPVDGADPRQRGAWLDAVYSDDVLTTQLGHARGPQELGGRVHVRATSSTTTPSLMADMLEALEVTDTSRVLEVGTGTGYNAALLCARLGDGHVASVDIHPDLVADARARLAALGYHPALAAGDGAAGLAGAAPFDRIVATCSVPAIPPAWVDQLAPGGILVADLRGDIGGGLVKLHRRAPGTARGRFLPVSGTFMRLRPDAHDPLHRGESLEMVLDRRETRDTTTGVDPAALDDPQVAFLAQLHLPGVRLYPPADGARLLFADEDLWAEAHETPAGGGVHRVTYAGDRNLYEGVERAHSLWEGAGHPGRERFGLTVTPTGQHAWLDREDGPSWELPAL